MALIRRILAFLKKLKDKGWSVTCGNLAKDSNERPVKGCKVTKRF